MFSRCQFKTLFVVLLLGLFLSQGCGEIISTVEFVATPTAVTSIPHTSASYAGPAATLSPGLLDAAQVIFTAIETNQPEMLRILIGDEGVAAGGFAQGVDLKGYNNADEIVAAFDDALDRSTHICEGFVPNMGTLPDKATLVYRGMEFDWSQFGLSGTSAGGMTLTLFKMPEGWRLTYITPFDFEWGPPILGPMQDCPAVSSFVTATADNTPAPTRDFPSTPESANTVTVFSSLTPVASELLENPARDLDLSRMSVQE
jgi:hypothetical protein